MYSQAARFDDPQFSAEFSILQESDEIADSCQDSVRVGSGRELENDDAARALRWEAQHVTEVMVQRDERAIFCRAYLKEMLVRGADKLLIFDRCDVMAGQPQQLGSPIADVLVELEFHAT